MNYTTISSNTDQNIYYYRKTQQIVDYDTSTFSKKLVLQNGYFHFLQKYFTMLEKFA